MAPVALCHGGAAAHDEPSRVDPPTGRTLPLQAPRRSLGRRTTCPPRSASRSPTTTSRTCGAPGASVSGGGGGGGSSSKAVPLVTPTPRSPLSVRDDGGCSHGVGGWRLRCGLEGASGRPLTTMHPCAAGAAARLRGVEHHGARAQDPQGEVRPAAARVQRRPPRHRLSHAPAQACRAAQHRAGETQTCKRPLQCPIDPPSPPLPPPQILALPMWQPYIAAFVGRCAARGVDVPFVDSIQVRRGHPPPPLRRPRCTTLPGIVQELAAMAGGAAIFAPLLRPFAAVPPAGKPPPPPPPAATAAGGASPGTPGDGKQQRLAAAAGDGGGRAPADRERLRGGAVAPPSPRTPALAVAAASPLAGPARSPAPPLAAPTQLKPPLRPPPASPVPEVGEDRERLSGGAGASPSPRTPQAPPLRPQAAVAARDVPGALPGRPPLHAHGGPGDAASPPSLLLLQGQANSHAQARALGGLGAQGTPVKALAVAGIMPRAPSPGPLQAPQPPGGAALTPARVHPPLTPPPRASGPPRTPEPIIDGRFHGRVQLLPAAALAGPAAVVAPGPLPLPSRDDPQLEHLDQGGGGSGGGGDRVGHGPHHPPRDPAHRHHHHHHVDPPPPAPPLQPAAQLPLGGGRASPASGAAGNEAPAAAADRRSPGPPPAVPPAPHPRGASHSPAPPRLGAGAGAPPGPPIRAAAAAVDPPLAPPVHHRVVSRLLQPPQLRGPQQQQQQAPLGAPTQPPQPPLAAAPAAPAKAAPSSALFVAAAAAAAPGRVVVRRLPGPAPPQLSPCPPAGRRLSGDPSEGGGWVVAPPAAPGGGAVRGRPAAEAARPPPPHGAAGAGGAVSAACEARGGAAAAAPPQRVHASPLALLRDPAFHVDPPPLAQPALPPNKPGPRGGGGGAMLPGPRAR